VELRLESVATPGSELPLRIGARQVVRVTSVHHEGDSKVDRTSWILSIGPELAGNLPAIEPGTTTITIVTKTLPDLAGAQVAIGGGPTLVRDGKPMRWNGLMKMRHPRSALGWNDEYLILMQVDGRQLNLSLGMTFPELAEYMVKLGCNHAMNLDGGGSATLWVLGNVINNPSEGAERAGPNALVVLKKRSPD
jgi:hypothetical protein